jgi:hypothetical protein
MEAGHIFNTLIIGTLVFAALLMSLPVGGQNPIRPEISSVSLGELE